MQKAKSVSIPLQKLVPSIITVFALCLGITAIRYSLIGKFNISAALIIIAAFMDGLDGRLARLLNSTSEFGAQLDSLADLISFGVSPGITIYIWSLYQIPYKGVGWAIVLFYVTCSALRLARFNTQVGSDEDTEKSQIFFTGVPMPVAAGLALLPMILNFEIAENYNFSPWAMAIYMIIIGFLMISTIPTFSSKKVSINKKYAAIFLLCIAMITAGMILEPWIILPLIGILYLCSIPFSIFYYYKYKRNNK